MLLDRDAHVADFKKNHPNLAWSLIPNHNAVMEAFRFDFKTVDQALPWIFSQGPPAAPELVFQTATPRLLFSRLR